MPDLPKPPSRISELLKTIATPARLVFIIDATMSREKTWDLASSLQSQMFQEAAKVGSLELQVVYFRGESELKQSPWMMDGPAVARLMSKVSCRAGHTQIRRALECVKNEHQKQKVAAVVYIGDAMEEDHGRLCDAAAGLGVKLFMFQEGNIPEATDTFTQMARLSGGAHCTFDAGAARQLAELLRAVAAFATGGVKALENMKTASATLLLGQMEK
jgi:hypothetical protein